MLKCRPVHGLSGEQGGSRVDFPPIAGSESQPLRTSPAPLWVILAAVLLTFAPLTTADFVSWDDFETVARNPLMNPPTLESVGHYWTHPHMDLYVPVTYSFWAGVASLARTGAPDAEGIWLNPTLFHAANILLHLGAALVVYQILRLLVRSDWPAAIGALLFALHPVQVEAVAWVSGAKDLLAGLFALLAIWQYLEFAAARDGGEQRRWHYVAATLAFLLAVLSKPAAVMTPAAILAIDFLLLHRPWRRTVATLWPWGVIAAGGMVVAKLVQPSTETFATPLWARPLVAADALAVYLGKLVWPAKLAIDYGRPPEWLLSSTAICWTWLVPLAACVVCWKARKRWPWLAAGGLVGVTFLLPVLGLVKFDFQRHSTVADHYLYAAMLGPAMVVAYALSHVRLRWAYASAAVVLVALAARSVAQTMAWKDSESLYRNTVAVNPTSLAGNDGLGSMALRAGHPDEAIARYQAAIEGHPGDPVASYNLANALLMTGRAREAVDLYRAALRGRPGPHIYTNLATALARSGEVDQAIEACREGVVMYPTSGQLHLTLGTLLAARGDREAAASEYEAAARYEPTLATMARDGLDALDRNSPTLPTSRPTTR